MAKRGDEYQELVGAVQKALDPGATVEVGKWVEGPDGRRDMDVSVRGYRDRIPYFALIECKDWKDPVGIAAIDGLDSKRRDLGADLAIVFSNSGYTEDAARKARRVGIELASALKEGDPLVRVEVTRTFIARRRSVNRWIMVLGWTKERSGPEDFHPFDVTFRGLPLVNWIRRDSLELLKQYFEASRIQMECAFAGEQEFLIRGRPYLLTGLVYKVECSLGWVSQSVREDVTLGSYDFLRGRVVVPNEQTYVIGPFDNKAWRDCDPPPTARSEMEPGTFELEMVLFAPVNGIEGLGTPDLDVVIGERLVTTPE